MNLRSMSLLPLVLLSLALCHQQSLAQGKITYWPAKPIHPGPPPPPTIPIPLVMPLFLEGNQFSSTLTLVNSTTANTYADVTVRATDGTVIGSQRVKFQPHSQQLVSVGALLEKTVSAATAGSILIKQSAALMGPSIAGVLSMTYLGSTDPNYIDEEPSVLSSTGSQVLQGVANRSNGSPIVALSSVAKTVQHINVECLGEAGTISSKKVELAPGATLLLDPCAAQSTQGLEIESALEPNDGDLRGPIGIKLTSDAKSGSFAAFALAPHRKHDERFYGSVLFVDPNTVKSPNSVFTGVPVGPATLLPEGNYTPQISMTNFSANPIHVHVALAQTSGSAPKSYEVGSATVPPGSSRELVVRDLVGDPDLQNSFIISSDGSPGGLMAKLVATSDSRLRELDLQAKDESDSNNAGMHPWSIEQNMESTLLLFNHSKTPQNFDVTIFGGGVYWQKTYKLAPLETKAVGIRDLIDNETKDDRGRLLPKSVASGELNWMDVNPTYGSGRVLQSNRTTGMARNFSCGYSGLLCGADFDEYQETFSDGEVIDYAEIQPLTCTSGSQNACSGQQTGEGGSFSYSWGSGNTSVASIANNTGTSQTVSLLGVSPGTSNINGQVRSAYCSAGGSGPAQVVPVLSSSQQLWYFGAGITPPPSFNQGGVTSVITAEKASGGSYYWTITSGSTKASFASSSQQTSETTSSNSVTIYSIGYSTATNDVTVQVTWTPPEGSPVPATLNLTIDSPYSLASAGATINKAVGGSCPNPQTGSTGYQSLPVYTIKSFTGVYISNIGINEVLGSLVSDYAGNNWPAGAEGSQINPGQFYDNICVIVPAPTYTPPSSVPQSPLSSTKIYHRSQAWYAGYTANGEGVSVQNDTLQLFIDHGVNTGITSPTR